MVSDPWPDYCRDLLVASLSSATALFPGRGEAARERVHSVRKALKESRALARLFLNSVGEPARVTIATLAVVRRKVGQTRDLDVIDSRLAGLEPTAEVARRLGAAIERERAASRRAHTAMAARAARTQLQVIVKRIDTLDLTRITDGDIVDAVARTYRQARERGRLAFGSEAPEALHALRSRVVDLRYQLAALSPAWPAALNAQAEELNALRESLGDFNDLNVLHRFATERGGLTSDALAALAERVGAKQRRLRVRSEVGYERLFADTPAAFAHRLGAWLERPKKLPRVGAPTGPEPSPE